jgi:hypothetical protein
MQKTLVKAQIIKNRHGLSLSESRDTVEVDNSVQL